VTNQSDMSVIAKIGGNSGIKATPVGTGALHVYWPCGGEQVPLTITPIFTTYEIIDGLHPSPWSTTAGMDFPAMSN